MRRARSVDWIVFCSLHGGRTLDRAQEPDVRVAKPRSKVVAKIRQDVTMMNDD